MADTIRIKRRATGGAAGAPGALFASELAYNEVDDTFWYGKGNSGGNATSIVPVGGIGSFLPLTGGTLSGLTIFNAGLNFGSVVDTANNNANRHIWLYGIQYGIGVTGGRLNFISNGSFNFVNNSNADIATISSTGVLNLGNSGNYLRITPNNGALSSALTFEIPGTTSSIYFNCGLFIPFSTPSATGIALNLGNNSHQLRANSGQDGASMSVANISMNSWNGIGFGPNITGVNIPQWMYGIALNVRTGSFVNYGDNHIYNVINNGWSNIQFVMFQRVGTDQQLRMDGNSYVPSAPVVAAGGSGWAVNDRAYDTAGNTYTITAISSGAVTTLNINATSAMIGSPPTNPLTLTAAPGFAGTGLTINLTWTQMQRLVINAPTTNFAGTVTCSNTFTLNADPTANLHAATKQYVDSKTGSTLSDAPNDGKYYTRRNLAWSDTSTAFLPLTGGKLTGGFTVGATTYPVTNPPSTVGIVTDWIAGLNSTGSSSFYWNSYYDGTNYRSVNSTQIGAVIFNSTTALNISVTAPVAAGGIQSAFNGITINSAGALSVPGGSLWVYSIGNFGLTYDSTNFYLFFQTGSIYGFYWNRSSGDCQYVTAGGSHFVMRTSDGLCYAVKGPGGGLGAYANISDIRTKRDIEEVTVGLDVIEQIQPKSFHRIKNNEQQYYANGELFTMKEPKEIGFVAQDLIDVLPEAIYRMNDEDNPLLAVTSETILAVAINAIKELSTRVAQLEAKL